MMCVFVTEPDGCSRCEGRVHTSPHTPVQRGRVCSRGRVCITCEHLSACRASTCASEHVRCSVRCSARRRRAAIARPVSANARHKACSCALVSVGTRCVKARGGVRRPGPVSPPRAPVDRLLRWGRLRHHWLAITSTN